ncbi:MAG TPA: cupin domain-containing protein [Anaerolineales bacterium]|nr:cupin domain-containing protein [Anaerolineales bacterium]
MKSINLFENWEFDDKGPHADPLYVDRNGRVILFTLKPGQTIREHNAPSSPFYVIILGGRGIFTGGDGVERVAGSNTLLVFEPGEQHSVHALDNLVFIGFLHGAPGAQITSPALRKTDEVLR